MCAGYLLPDVLPPYPVGSSSSRRDKTYHVTAGPKRRQMFLLFDGEAGVQQNVLPSPCPEGKGGIRVAVHLS